jgi:hypothetical protein
VATEPGSRCLSLIVCGAIKSTKREGRKWSEILRRLKQLRCLVPKSSCCLQSSFESTLHLTFFNLSHGSLILQVVRTCSFSFSTHNCPRYLYREGVEFWDIFCDSWRVSVLSVHAIMNLVGIRLTAYKTPLQHCKN